MAEAILNGKRDPRFTAFSAGSHPAGRIQPGALAQLASVGLSTQGLRSKSWDEFSGPGTPPIDFVFTLCDHAAAQVCPVWPGHPRTAHWGVFDPVMRTREETERAFREAYNLIERRIDAFLALPFESLDEPALLAAIKRIGRA
jgi:arsenate reductase